MSITNCRALAAAAVLAWAVPTWAHHSHGNYETDHYLEMQGTVREIHWINPHTWVYMEVANEDGSTTLWTLEGGSINALMRRGWTEDSFDIGDTIDVRCHPLRGGATSCRFGFLSTADGQEG